jgi:hypothetical protein
VLDPDPTKALDPSAIAVPYPAVLKPRDGAGSQHTYLVPDALSLPGVVRAAVRNGLRGDALVQPFLPGTPVSVSVLTGRCEAVALQPSAQRISQDGRFQYLGGALPLDAQPAARAVALARRAVAAVPGLLGYVGVDLVLACDGLASGLSWLHCPSCGLDQDMVLEINPRLTTSYVGLRALARSNLAERMLEACRGDTVAPVEWKPGSLCFTTDGTVTWHRP